METTRRRFSSFANIINNLSNIKIILKKYANLCKKKVAIKTWRWGRWSRTILPEGLLFVVHPRHDGFLGHILIQVRVDHRLGQLKISLVHLFLLLTDSCDIIKARRCTPDDAREPHREMSRRVLEELSVADRFNPEHLMSMSGLNIGRITSLMFLVRFRIWPLRSPFLIATFLSFASTRWWRSYCRANNFPSSPSSPSRTGLLL